MNAKLWAQPPLFLAAFATLALVTARIQYLYPLSPGLDFHYHLMCAAMNGRSSAEPLSALYYAVEPYGANTLLYSISYPFEKVTDPVRAFQIACTIAYYIGYPLGCAYALIRTGRSPWGSLLAFPLSHGLTSMASGYWTFLTAASFIAPAMAEMEIFLGTSGRRARVAGIACAVFCVLAFLGHATVFGVLSLLLAIHTLTVIGVDLKTTMFVSLRSALVRALRTGLGAVLVILPASLVFVRWYWHVTYGSAKAPGAITIAQPPEPAMSAKLFNTVDFLAPTKAENEHLYMALLGIVVLGALVYGARRIATRSSIFERSFLLMALSFVLFPAWFHHEAVASRQFDLTILLLPLVLYPAPVKLRGGAGLSVVLLFAFSLLRVRAVGEQLRILNEVDFGGLLRTAETCKRVVPHDRVSKLAFVNGKVSSVAFRSGATRQLHETLAAQCGLETPVYDTQVYPHNLVPLRYVGAMPAPVTIIENTTQWYLYPDLWKNFEYVLVNGWTMTPADDAALSKRAQLVAKYGDFQLWGRK
jgi:hypothetical protein